jgi:branched-chain amino acid transport system permease protein
MLKLNLLILLNGVSEGARLFIIASGLTLSFSLMRIVNLSHGVFYMLGGYVGYTVMRVTGSYILAIIAGFVVLGVIGLGVERGLLPRILNLKDPELPQTLLTLALAVVFTNVMLIIWGGYPLRIDVPKVLNFPMNILGTRYPFIRMFQVVVAAVIGIGLWIFIVKTRIGAMIRAGVDDRQTASALGIRIPRVFTVVFIISAVLASLAGIIGGTNLTLSPGQDVHVLLFALVVIIVGGLGSMVGSAIGALIVGIVSTFGKVYVPEIAFLLTFSPMLIILAFRPQGLMGKR